MTQINFDDSKLKEVLFAKEESIPFHKTKYVQDFIKNLDRK